MRFTTTIWAKTQFRGFHRWPDAPGYVGYLRDTHRHLFKVFVEVYVTHNDRQVEFHTLQKDVDRVIELNKLSHAPNANTNTIYSCEQMAGLIASDLAIQGYMIKMVSVSEDGECGGNVYPEENNNG